MGGLTRRGERHGWPACRERRGLHGCRERGAALTELFVLLAALVPLMFGIPMIGKLVDLKQTAVQASRYSAWELTVDEDGRAPDDVRARFFSDASAPILSQAGTPPGNALWGAERVASAGVTSGPMADTHVAIVDASATATAPTDAHGGEGGAAHGVAYRMGELVDDAGNLVSRFAGGKWDMEADGLLRAGVSVGVGANGWLPAATLEEHSVILHDGWSAPSDEVAARRTRSFVPAGGLGEDGMFEGVERVLVLAGRLEPVKELVGLKDAFGRVDMEALPPSETGERPLKAYEEVR